MEEALKDSILSVLEVVMDPELGIGIVSLGLVYKVDVNDEGLCTVEVTLTLMRCPLGPQIIEQVKSVLAKILEVSDTEVMIVWSPPWNKGMMSRYTKVALGIG